MKRKVFVTLLTVLLLLTASCKKEAQRTLIDFEDLQLPASGYWNGSGGEGGFVSGKARFPNHYNQEWDAWSGFAYTNHKDAETPDYENMYSSIAGSGAGGSENYAVYFYYEGLSDTIWFDTAMRIENIAVSNTTFTYYTMLYGNPFAKKFGGESGNDKDWYRLSLTAIDKTGTSAVGHVGIMLADYRFDDNSRDYIANIWTDIDLSQFGYISGLVVKLESSDSGEFGINTPAYFCIDNIVGVLPEQSE